MLALEGSARGDPDGRADRAELPSAPVGRGHDGRAVRARGRRDRRGDPRHAQDDARPARAREGGGRGRRRHQPPSGPVRRDPDQGEPRGARRRGGGGGAPGPRATPPSSSSRSSAGRSPRSTRRLRPARGSCCSTTCRSTSCAPLWLGSPAGRSSRRAAAFTLETLRAVASTGVDFISVGAITHSAPALDLSLLLEPIP